jgi:hypothetical protein
MKRNVFLLLAAIVFVVVTVAPAQVKKYDIKSGIITYESIMKMGNFEEKNKIIVYFDDYGIKECKETFSNAKLEESNFSDGKDLYLVKHKQKIAYKQGSADRGTELRVEWMEFGTEKDRQSGKYKKLPAMKVAGKNCEMFEFNEGKENITQYGGWNKILLYMNLKTKSVQNIQRALDVKENVEVPPEKFKVPAGYAVKQ